MRVLHLPVNVASQTAITVRALREIGVRAKGLALANSIFQDPQGLLLLPAVQGLGFLGTANQLIRRSVVVLSEIAKADVLHWHFGATALVRKDLKWARLLRKPSIVEFWGSDIRIPEEECKDNPYYAAMGKDYEYRESESREQSYTRQRTFLRHGVRTCFAPQSFDRYLIPNAWKKVYRNRSRIRTSEYSASPPSATKRRPLLVHSPTAPIGKGTPSVLRAVEKLKGSLDFDFKLIKGLPHHEALELIRSCDLFLDQFVDGTYYGVSSIEAMAFGKPVVCYLKPSTIAFLPPDVPVVVATQDNLPEILDPLIRDAQRRHDLGVRGRAYVEKHHDSVGYAKWLVTVYRELIQDHNRD